MEGDRLLSGDDVVTDDLLHIVADMRDIFEWYNFTDGPVNLPDKWFWKSSKTKFEVKLRG